MTPPFGHRFRGIVFVGVSALASPAVLAAQSGEIRGSVRDSAGAAIAAAAVQVHRPSDPARHWSTGTDADGRYRLPGLPAGEYVVRVRRIGYGRGRRVVEVADGAVVRADFVLAEQAVEAEGIEVEAERRRSRSDVEAGATVHEIDAPQLESLPGLAEADVLRAVAVLPGVVSTSDFTAAFNVRGGSADQNLILLDGVPIFNPFHLGGLFSVFNSDMVGRAELFAGGFPVRFGGRVSSVLEVETDPGDGEFRGDAAISLLASRLAVGGGLPDGVTDALGLRSLDWRVSARRSYFDQLFKPFFDFPYHLRDLQAFSEAWTERGDRITVTAYTGDDVLDFSSVDSDDFPLRLRWQWGNDVAGARWLAPIGGGMAEVRAGYTRFASAIRFPDFDDTRLDSRISQGAFAVEFDLPATSALDLGVGVQADRLAYDNLAESGGTVFQEASGEGWRGGAYAQASWRPADDWLLGVGVRGDGWSPEGDDRTLVASPRLSVKRSVGADDEGALTLSVGRYAQFLHSLRDEQLPIGIDVWVTAGRRAPHIISDQAQTGFEWRRDDGWHGSIEAYYRTFEGVVTNNFAQDPNDPLDDLLTGDGRSYGVDLMVGRDADRGASGWVAVSWLRATRTFPDEASGLVPPPRIRYPPVFDRRLDIDLVLRYDLPWDVQGGLRFNFGTGLPYTKPLGSYNYFGYGIGTGRLSADDDIPPAVVLGPRNGARYPRYHRLDLSVRKPVETDWARLVPYLSVINVLNRRNVLFYFYEYDRSPPVRTGVSMFPLLPTFGVEVTF